MATAALPILASTLYNNSDSSTNASHLQDPHSIRLTNPVVGLDPSTATPIYLTYPSVTCLATPGPETLSPALILHLITTHLLSSPNAKVTAILDTNGFDVRGLRNGILRGLRERRTGGEEDGEFKARAMEVLKRVTLMRVFDFVGMGESLREARNELESGRERAVGLDGRDGRKRWEVEEEVADSEGSGEEEDLLAQENREKKEKKEKKEEEKGEEEQGPGLLLIDNFSHLIGPVLKKDFVRGQAVLHSFLRSLRHLTLEFGLATLLVTGAEARPTSVNRNEAAPSIFSSCLLKPDLGMAVGSWLDMYLLVHPVPRTAQDARTVYGTQQQGEQRQRTAGQMVSVVEVLFDRFGQRLGRWIALEMAVDGELREIL